MFFVVKIDRQHVLFSAMPACVSGISRNNQNIQYQFYFKCFINAQERTKHPNGDTEKQKLTKYRQAIYRQPDDALLPPIPLPFFYDDAGEIGCSWE